MLSLFSYCSIIDCSLIAIQTRLCQVVDKGKNYFCEQESFLNIARHNCVFFYIFAVY
ncbi:hypothetical protein HMPREF0673_02676 [Leyella stercorea DSM 18206]|uniref:Uncharacterized protein n=1 Tax=Leyella stercorea DSM 18206 TaxID=1002367 RepID=G6B1A4_9BACT|nr:hypothetical protein HMPREF0673_02676 [Leyella stercorea DSM 18206]